MKLKIEISNDCTSSWSPDENTCRSWLESALDIAEHNVSSYISLRFVDENEMTALNNQYRNKDSVSNVLSFPADLPASMAATLDRIPLGDIVICPAVVTTEASSQGKTREAHCAHLLVHGCLHLLGYDHQQQEAAASMEQLEIRALESLGFSNPYLIG